MLFLVLHTVQKAFKVKKDWCGYTVTPAPLLLAELILVMLPVEQTKRLSWSLGVAWWVWHCDVHRTLGCGIRGEERMVFAR